MTIEQRMIANLQNHGMLTDEARDVMDLFKADPLNGPMREHWNDSADRFYHLAMWLDLKRFTRSYLAEHNPTATYRSFFED